MAKCVEASTAVHDGVFLLPGSSAGPMTKPEQIIYVVDDDAKMRKSLRFLLESANYTVQTFESAEEFRKQYDPAQAGCMVLDVSMPGGMSGIDLQKELATEEHSPPIIFLTGHGDIPLAVRAMEAGAVGFLEKPFNADDLLQRVEAALERDRGQRQAQADLADVRDRLERLTERERQVLMLVVAAKSSKDIAAELALGVRTVENHRAAILRKMKAESTPDLVRMIMAAGGGPS